MTKEVQNVYMALLDMWAFSQLGVPSWESMENPINQREELGMGNAPMQGPSNFKPLGHCCSGWVYGLDLGCGRGLSDVW